MFWVVTNTSEVYWPYSLPEATETIWIHIIVKVSDMNLYILRASLSPSQVGNGKSHCISWPVSNAEVLKDTFDINCLCPCGKKEKISNPYVRNRKRAI